MTNNDQLLNIIQSVEFELDPISFEPYVKFVGHLKFHRIDDSIIIDEEEAKLKLGKALVDQLNEAILKLKYPDSSSGEIQ
jgi:hypothetical protein